MGKAERDLKMKLCYFGFSFVYLTTLSVFLYKDPIKEKLYPDSIPKK